MSQEVIFFKQASWAIPPTKEKIKAELVPDEDFRWIKQRRVKGACWPYRAAKELGWTVRSPIDVDIEPVSEMQITTEKPEDIAQVQHFSGISYWQQREGIYLGVKPSGWFQLHQFNIEGSWHQMFIPNGEGTFEWRLGWSVQIPNEYVLLFQPLEDADSGFVVHPGLLASKGLERFRNGLGLPIAFEPKKAMRIKRNDPLAKHIVLHQSALALKGRIVE